MELSALRHIVTSLFFIKNSDQLQNSMPNLGKLRGSCELYNSECAVQHGKARHRGNACTSPFLGVSTEFHTGRRSQRLSCE
jgi:hypothetical protein